MVPWTACAVQRQVAGEHVLPVMHCYFREDASTHLMVALLGSSRLFGGVSEGEHNTAPMVD